MKRSHRFSEVQHHRPWSHFGTQQPAPPALRVLNPKHRFPKMLFDFDIARLVWFALLHLLLGHARHPSQLKRDCYFPEHRKSRGHTAKVHRRAVVSDLCVVPRHEVHCRQAPLPADLELPRSADRAIERDLVNALRNLAPTPKVRSKSH